MRRVSMTSCVVSAGVVGYGAFGLAGLATGLNVWWASSDASASLQVISPAEVIASRFPVATSRDVAGPQAAMFRAAVLRSEGVMTPSARNMRSAALRYGVLETGLRPSELAPAGTTEQAITLSPVDLNVDSTMSWHEAFVARILTKDQAANFTLLPASAAIARVENGGAATRQPPVVVEVDVKPQATPPSSAVTPHRRPRPGGVLNDTQIASIKSRLNLTPEQETMWPAVEAALRNISYSKGTAVQVQTSRDYRMAYVDPNGPEVQQLKYAALPLVMRLSDDQKREVKSLAHVMGLDGILNGASAWF